MDSFQLLNSFDFRFPMCFLFMTSSVMKHPLFSTGNTHNWEILRGKHASSEGHSRRNPWRRYSFNHRASGHPARSYMLRWGHLLGTKVRSRYGILFVKSHACCTFSCICHCNRHILRQMSRYFMVDFGKSPQGGRRQWRYMGHHLDAWLLTRSPPCNT